MATWKNRNAMEAILSHIVYLLNVTVRASTCTLMEMELLFSPKLANLTQKENLKLQISKLKEESGSGKFFPFNLPTVPLYMNKNVALVYSKIWLYLGEYFDVMKEYDLIFQASMNTWISHSDTAPQTFKTDQLHHWLGFLCYNSAISVFSIYKLLDIEN